jgi:fatty acid desaturase
LGPKYSLTYLAIGLIQYDASHDIHPNFASKFPDVLRTSHFPLRIQTFLMLFMVEIIFFGTQMRLAPFPLMACLLALIAITFPFIFFFYQICYSSLFVHLIGVGVGDFACWLLLELLRIPGLRLALVRLVPFLVA